MRRNQSLARRLDRFSDQIYSEMVRIDKLKDRIASFVDATDDIQATLDNTHEAYATRCRALAEASKDLNSVSWILDGLEEPLQEAVEKLLSAQEALIRSIESAAPVSPRSAASARSTG